MEEGSSSGLGTKGSSGSDETDRYSRNEASQGGETGTPTTTTTIQNSQTDGTSDVKEGPAMGGENLHRQLTREECEDELGFSRRQRWWILAVIALVQISMNFNTSLYSNGIAGLAQEFHVSKHVARAGAAVFLVTYAFGCELWAPWSEELGRKWVLQLSLTLTSIWTIPVGLAPNITTVLVSRALGGLSTAGGSVTLGMIADMYDPDSQQYAIAFAVFSSVFGSILGPVIGGFVEMLPPSRAWRWCTWIQLIVGVAVQLLHLCTVPETRATILMDRIAKRRRRSREDPNVYGPGETRSRRENLAVAKLVATWSRAFRMLVTEPIVRILSMLSGAADAVIFMQIQSMNLVYRQWGFNSWQIGLAFAPIAAGYVVAWLVFIPVMKRGQRRRAADPGSEHAQFELRLQLMTYLSLALPVGLVVFGVGGDPRLHWSLSMLGTALIGAGNYAIYMGTVDYMIAVYGPYAASATGGNGLARDLLAGILTPVAVPFYESLAPERYRSLMYASLLLAVVSVVLVACARHVYAKGKQYRRNSPFAQLVAR